MKSTLLVRGSSSWCAEARLRNLASPGTSKWCRLLHQARSEQRKEVLCAVAREVEPATRATSEADYTKIAKAVEARLAKLHAEAPEDADMSSVAAQAMLWDEGELLREGGKLQQADRPISSQGAGPSQRAKPAPLPPDVNAERKRQGRRLIISEVPLEALPKVAIIGRPNVGKSALFNRIVGRSAAIVYDRPGITRDRLYVRANWGGREFVLVDTGGLMSSAASMPAAIVESAMAEVSAKDLPFAIERQAAAGVDEADALVLVVDGQEGPTAADEGVMAWLRRTHGSKPVLLAVNKCESATAGDTQAAAFWGHGHEPLAISAISGTGTGDLLERLLDALPPPPAAAAEAREMPLAVAIVGRPNVGKSSLVNAIAGGPRAIVSDLSGTTRDAVDTEVVLPDGTPLRLVDTAGIRRRARIATAGDGAESMSTQRAIRALRRTDVVVLMLDATAGVTAQDFRIAELAAAEGRAVVLVVNKWDTVEDRSAARMRAVEGDLKAQLRPVAWAKAVFTSATQGKNVHKVLKACIDAGAQHAKRVPTATLNIVVREATQWKAPPSARGSSKKPRVIYATQAAVRPPTFVFFCNDGRLIGDDYTRYLERSLRESVDLEGTPVRLLFRGKAGTEPSKRAVVA